MSYTIQFIWCILAILQAFHNYYSYYIDDYQNPFYTQYNSKYHSFQLMREIGITLVVSILLQNYISFFILIGIRFIFFQYSLNIISDKTIWYLSNRGTDLMIKNVLGKYASQIVLFVSIVIIIILNIFYGRGLY